VATLLPCVGSYQEYLASPRDEQTYRAAVEAICQRHRLPLEPLKKYPGGSTIVFAIGATHVVKLFEPIFTDDAATEHAVLRHLQGRLAVPTPAVVAVGDLEGWRYIVMDQLRGRSLVEAWDDIPSSERVSLYRRLGEATAGLHALAPPPALPGPDWSTFVHQQVERCVEQQRGNGLAEHWVQQIPAFLAAQDLSSLGQAAQVLLHSEIMREHVLVEETDEQWVLSGLFDFEPARLGAAEYELASVGVFLAAGEPELLRSFLLGYGYAEAQLTPELQERILLYTLLHRYSNLRWYLERLPPAEATTLHELAAEWFAFA
jgi:hygromycin-B 7''-O-kinase